MKSYFIFGNLLGLLRCRKFFFRQTEALNLGLIPGSVESGKELESDMAGIPVCRMQTAQETLQVDPKPGILQGRLAKRSSSGWGGKCSSSVVLAWYLHVSACICCSMVSVTVSSDGGVEVA